MTCNARAGLPSARSSSARGPTAAQQESHFSDIRQVRLQYLIEQPLRARPIMLENARRNETRRRNACERDSPTRLRRGPRCFEMLARLGRSQQRQIEFYSPDQMYAREQFPMVDLFRDPERAAQ